MTVTSTKIFKFMGLISVLRCAIYNRNKFRACLKNYSISFSEGGKCSEIYLLKWKARQYFG